MAKKTAFTPATIDNLTAGRQADPLMPGLAIEVLPSGKKRWRYRRKITGKKIVATLFGGLYPAKSIAEARAWASNLNEKVEAGIDPRVTQRETKAVAQMTVAYAHELYMIAVLDGRASRRKRTLKPRTIKLKSEIYKREIAPKIGKLCIYEVTEHDLIQLVEGKGKISKVSSNLLASELKAFFGWAASLTGSAVGLSSNPAIRLSQLRFPQSPRSRILSLEELEWFLQALIPESRTVQRGFLLFLLTAARISEVIFATSEEYSVGVWTIPSDRVKNSIEHRIALGPWGQSLMRTNGKWIFESDRIEGPMSKSSWYNARDRVHKRMEEISGRVIKPFTPHDFRRTARSNTKRLNVDYETAEAMLNHAKQGLERIYDLYELEEEKRIWFLKWENEILRIAERAGVAEALGAPVNNGVCSYSFNMTLPKSPGFKPTLNVGTTKPGAIAKLVKPAANVIFTWETRQTPLPEPIDLPPGQSGK